MTEPERFPIIKTAAQPLAFRSEPLAQRSLNELAGPTECLPVNRHPVNQICKRLLLTTGEQAHSSMLYPLQLLHWGLHNVSTCWDKDEYEMQCFAERLLYKKVPKPSHQTFLFGDFDSFESDVKEFGFETAFNDHMDCLRNAIEDKHDAYLAAALLIENFHYAMRIIEAL